MTRIIVLLAACLLGFSMPASGAEKTILMGFKDESKLPLIGNVDDNTGVFQELFSKSAEMIGYRLKIVRMPKKRLYLKLKTGEIDFYPSSSFSEERATYLAFLKNGLETKEVLITRPNISNVRHFSDLFGIMLADLGGSKSNFSDKYQDITVLEVSSLSFEQAVDILQRARADFYIADIEEVENYRKSMGLTNFKDIGLTVHYDFFGDMMPMYMGFSMNSPLVRVTDNPRYQNDQPMDYENTATIISEDCIAYQFFKALMQLKENGETQKLYDSYLHGADLKP